MNTSSVAPASNRTKPFFLNFGVYIYDEEHCSSPKHVILHINFKSQVICKAKKGQIVKTHWFRELRGVELDSKQSNLRFTLEFDNGTSECFAQTTRDRYMIHKILCKIINFQKNYHMLSIAEQSARFLQGFSLTEEIMLHSLLDKKGQVKWAPRLCDLICIKSSSPSSSSSTTSTSSPSPAVSAAITIPSSTSVPPTSSPCSSPPSLLLQCSSEHQNNNNDNNNNNNSNNNSNTNNNANNGPHRWHYHQLCLYKVTRNRTTTTDMYQQLQQQQQHAFSHTRMPTHVIQLDNLEEVLVTGDKEIRLQTETFQRNFDLKFSDTTTRDQWLSAVHKLLKEFRLFSASTLPSSPLFSSSSPPPLLYSTSPPATTSTTSAVTTERERTTTLRDVPFSSLHLLLNPQHQGAVNLKHHKFQGSHQYPLSDPEETLFRTSASSSSFLMQRHEWAMCLTEPVARRTPQQLIGGARRMSVPSQEEAMQNHEARQALLRDTLARLKEDQHAQRKRNSSM